MENIRFLLKLATCADLNPHSDQDAICGCKVHGCNDVLPITLDEDYGGRDDMDLAAAALECHMQGARLCTAAELEAGTCCNRGCQGDAFLIWSSTACDPPSPPSPPSAPSPPSTANTT